MDGGARAGGTFLLIADEGCSRERWQMFAEQVADRVAKPIVRRGARCACRRAWRCCACWRGGD
jgi:hypothetical protein